jgi:integrase/recombinase XerD
MSVTPFRIEDMSVRKLGEETHNDYIRHVRTISTFLGHAPAKATPENLRGYQAHQNGYIDLLVH